MARQFFQGSPLLTDDYRPIFAYERKLLELLLCQGNSASYPIPQRVKPFFLPQSKPDAHVINRGFSLGFRSLDDIDFSENLVIATELSIPTVLGSVVSLIGNKSISELIDISCFEVCPVRLCDVSASVIRLISVINNYNSEIDNRITEHLLVSTTRQSKLQGLPLWINLFEVRNNLMFSVSTENVMHNSAQSIVLATGEDRQINIVEVDGRPVGIEGWCAVPAIFG